MTLRTKKLQKISIILFVFLASILLNPVVTAQNYYADIQINVDSSGIVDIHGFSNYPNLIVENSKSYTYMKQGYWLLNITTQEEFSDYIYVLTLPEGSVINHIKASGFRGIEEGDGKLIISGEGQDEPLSIVVQYQINSQSSNYYVILSLFIVSIIVLIILLIYYLRKDKKKKIPEGNKEENYNFKGLSERQKEIVQLLIDMERPLTQAEIQKELDIPKAAVSRNVHSLELKDIVEIEKIGMSNLIRLKKQ